MPNTRFFHSSMVAAAAVLIANCVGCSNLPGNSKQQGAVIGGLGGAAAGAAVAGDEHRGLGALLGGALGAGGGYVIGASRDRANANDREAVQQAAQSAQTSPATVADARNATTADLNNDGFVTMDEVVALDNAGLTDQEILNRLSATGQVFQLTSEQQQYLIDQGLSRMVVDQMQSLNRAGSGPSFDRQNGVISQPAPAVR